MQQNTGVLLVNLGTPSAPTTKAVKQFLLEFLSDPLVIDLPRIFWQPLLRGIILPLRCKRLAKKYQEIWYDNGSPLHVITEKQCDKLTEKLYHETLHNIPVAIGMTYQNPSIKQGIEKLIAQGVKNLLVLPLFPQNSFTTVTPVKNKVTDIIQKHFPKQFANVHIIQGYHDHPFYIKALADSIKNHQQTISSQSKLLFSFHGIPERYHRNGDHYPEQCYATARLVANALQLKEEEWQLAFQSRFGKAEWVKPYTLETLQQWGQRGIKSVTVISPGFAADCLETLEELNITNREQFLHAGGEEYHYIPALNDSDLHIHMMCEMVQQELYKDR